MNKHERKEAVEAKHNPPCCERLGFIISADFLSGIGFPPAATDKNAKMYRECDYPAICQALKRHIDSTI